MFLPRALPTILAVLSSVQDPTTLITSTDDPCIDEILAADNCLLNSPDVHDCQACVYGEVGAPNTGEELTCEAVNESGYCSALQKCMNFCDESVMENCEEEVEALEECLEAAAGGETEIEGNPLEEVLSCCLGEEKEDGSISQIA